MSAQLREAASVILLRRAEPGYEVFLLRRHQKASFMASAFVFPGGASEEGEDARTTAARELFEEAGVMLARSEPALDATTLEIPIQAQLRKRMLAGDKAQEVMSRARLEWSTEALVAWSHWITPSAEPKRFSARFFLGEIPAGQDPSFDDIETVDQVWVRPRQALEQAGKLCLPPPQLRTFWELAHLDTIEDVLAAGRARADEPHPIMPRLKGPTQADPRLCLLLPWDPEYTDAGTGDATPLTYTPSWAVGPSRFVMEDKAWKHVSAPGSTTTA